MKWNFRGLKTIQNTGFRLIVGTDPDSMTPLIEGHSTN